MWGLKLEERTKRGNIGQYERFDTSKTKFLGGFAALLCMVAALSFTSMRAMSSLNSALDRVVQRMSKRADKTSQLVETVAELSGTQQALLLHSILSDTAGIDQNKRAVGGLERRIDGLLMELAPFFDSPGDRQLVQALQRGGGGACGP